MLKKFISVSIFIFLVSPFLVLFFLLHTGSSLNWSETLWAFKNSFLQALLSSVFAVGLGFFVALGLLKIPERNRVSSSLLIVLCLFPQFVPTIIILIGIMNGLQPFPMGIAGIVLVHVFINFGLAAILIQNQMKALWGETSDVARTMGATRLSYWKRIGIPILKKDLLLIGLFFFSLCFCSFSVPLVVGGGRGTTLEVLIYEKMRLSSDWTAAVYLAWIQTIFVLILSIGTWRARAQTQVRETSLHWLGSYTGIVPLVLIMAAYFASFGSGLIEGIEQIGNLEPLKLDLIWGVLNSIALAAITYCLLILSLRLLTYGLVVPTYMDRFLNGYVAPSTSLTCFGILILLPAENIWSFVKIPVAFIILSLPAVYRLGWGETLKSLQNQIYVAQSFGASPRLIVKQVIWPQMKSTSRFMGALVATWVCGDFAVARILSTQDFSLGLILETLLTSYRMSLASVVSAGLMLLCGLCFFVIMGFDYVDRRSFKN